MIRLSRVSITEFKNHQKTDITFGQLTLLFGLQGSGKTTVAQAIAVAFTGQIPPLTDRRGAGLKYLVRQGQPEAEITLTINNGVGRACTVKRTIRETGQALVVANDGSDLKSRQTLLLHELGVNPEIIETLLNPALFADKPVDEQRQVLLKLIPSDEITIPAAALAVGIKTLGSVGEIDTHIKGLKEVQIRDLNYIIKHAEETLPEPPTAEELAAVGTLETALAAAERDRETASNRLAVLKAELGALARNQEAKKRAEKAKDALPGLRVQRDELTGKMAVYIKEGQALKESLEAKQDAESRAAERLRAARAEVASVESVGADCPTCLRALPAKDKERIVAERRKAVGELEKAVAPLHQEVERLSGELRAKAEELAGARKDLAVVESAINQYVGQESLSLPAVRTAEEIEGEVAGATNEYDAGTERVTECGSALEAAREAQRRADEIERLQAETASSRRKLEGLKAAVEALQKLKDELLTGDKAQAFEREVNTTWQALEPGSEVSVKPTGVTVSGVPAIALSSGQKVALDAALRVAAAKLSAFQLFAMDDANKLPKAQREKMLGLFAKSGCQVILCHTTDMPIKSSNGVKVYRLRSATLTGPVTVEAM